MVRRAVLVLTVPTLALIVLHLLAVYVFTGRPYVGSLVSLLRVGDEGNVPTWWNALLLSLAAMLATVLGVLSDRGRTPSRRSWFVVALALAYLSLDETASLHERLGTPVAAIAGRGDVTLPTYAWVFPGVVLGALGVLATARWVRDLPRDVGRQVLAALGLYLGGALGAEALTGWLKRAERTNVEIWAQTAEELAEMMACVLLVRAFLSLVEVDPPAGALRLREPAPR